MKELRIFLLALMLGVLIAIPFRWEKVDDGISIDRFANQGWLMRTVFPGPPGGILIFMIQLYIYIYDNNRVAIRSSSLSIFKN